MYRSFFKPLIGITLSILGLAVCGLPMLIIAIAIKMDSPVPSRTSWQGNEGVQDLQV